MELEKRIENIENEVLKLKSETKDFWDVIQIIGGMLIPVAIAYAGWEYSVAMKEAEIKSTATIANLHLKFNEQKESFNQRISETKTKIGQVALMSTLLEPLLSKDPTKRKLAIEAILIAMPAEGLKLVKVIEETDDTPSVQSFATNSIKNFRQSLFVDFFSENSNIRRNAYSKLFDSYKNDPSIIMELITKGKEHMSNVDSTVNILVFLSHMNRNLLGPYVSQIVEFADLAKENGPNTRARVRTLFKRLPCTGKEKQLLNSHIAESQRWIPIEKDLKLIPEKISTSDAQITIRKVTNNQLHEDITIAKGEDSVFIYQGYRYNWSLNTISKQFGSGDLRVNVSMTKQECK